MSSRLRFLFPFSRIPLDKGRDHLLKAHCHTTQTRESRSRVSPPSRTSAHETCQACISASASCVSPGRPMLAACRTFLPSIYKSDMDLPSLSTAYPPSPSSRLRPRHSAPQRSSPTAPAHSPPSISAARRNRSTALGSHLWRKAVVPSGATPCSEATAVRDGARRAFGPGSDGPPRPVESARRRRNRSRSP